MASYNELPEYKAPERTYKTAGMKTGIYNSVAMQFVEKGTTDEILFTGLASEVGEVMSERMREVRKGEERTKEIMDELSDVLWLCLYGLYVGQDECGCPGAVGCG